jgi:iron complex outermembrane receptor protein
MAATVLFQIPCAARVLQVPEETPVNTQTPRRGQPAARLTAVAGAVLLMSTLAAQAQTQPAQTVTVTGIRGAIESAISVKKNSDSIVEAVSAEDIGKLPDSSIAESIARLPGLSAQRVNGRATEINIRGLSGDFANTLLNGREQVSTGNNRSVEFDQYPSELLSSVLVYKTPDAQLLGQGLSGTIDLQTIRPLSVGKRVVSVNVRGEQNGKGTPFEGTGNRFNLSYIDQFANNTVGVALGFARLSQDVQKSRSETYGNSDTATNASLNGGNQFTFNQGFKYFVDTTKETRDGAMAVLEFKPNKDLSSVVDIFYSKFDKEVVKRGLEIQVNDSWKGESSPFYPTLTNAVFENNRLMSGVWGNVNPLSRHLWEPRKDELNSLGWNTKWKFAPKWTANADLSYSSAKSSERTIEMEAGQYDTANNRPLPESVTIANYNQVTGLQYDRNNLSTMRLTDPESWGQNGYDKIITTDDKIKALRLSAQRDLDGLFSRVDVGVNLSQRDKTKSAGEAKVLLLNRAGDNPGGALPAGTTALALPGTGLTTIAFDPASALSSYRFDANVNGDILGKGWTVNEKVTTFYAKGDLETKIFGIPVRGNAGVQVVNSDQQSTAPVVDNTNQGQYVFRTAGKTYTDLLPTVNLIFDLANDQIVRAGVGRQMARPRMDQLSAFTRSEVNTSFEWTGSGGNPKLDPFRATAVDVSYEKYFGTKGYVSVAGFYKKLSSYIFDFKNTNYDFTGFPNLSGRDPLSNIGEFTQPVNGKGGSISGVELAASVPLNMLTPMLDGFGVSASYSNTSSKIQPFGDGDTRPLPGLSRNVMTLTAYYEKHGFSFRVAARDRSKYIAEIEGFGANREYTYADKETVTDLQLGYEVQTGPVKGLNFLLQVNNVTNEPYRQLDTVGNQTKLDTYGRTMLFGVTYKF